MTSRKAWPGINKVVNTISGSVTGAVFGFFLCNVWLMLTLDFEERCNVCQASLNFREALPLDSDCL